MRSLLFICTFCCLSSCMALYGIHSPNRTPPDPSASTPRMVYLDTTYLQRLQTLPPDRPLLRKDLSQPLQFWYFENNTLIANAINCYASGFPNLHWDLKNAIANRQLVGSGAEQSVPMILFMQLFGIAVPEGDTFAIVTSTSFLGRQNKRFLKAVEQAVQEKNISRVYYFNMDEIFAVK